VSRPIADGVHFGITFIKAVGEFNWLIPISIPLNGVLLAIMVCANVAVRD